MASETIISILIGGVALIISVFSLGWNFYRDVILKARVKVTVGIGNIHHGGNVYGPYVSITVTNLGPGPINIQSIHMAKLSVFRFIGQPLLRLFHKENQYAHIIEDYTNEYSSKLPQKIDVGEYLNLPLPLNEDSALAVNPTHFGVIDSFGRFHWASKRSLNMAKQEYFEKHKKKLWGSD